MTEPLVHPKIVIFEVHPTQVQDWGGLGDSTAVSLVAEPLTLENAQAFTSAEIISTFLGSRLDAAVLNLMPSLKLIATRSTGFDHVDLQACSAKGTQVCNVPDYGDPTVAEFVFALTLALSRKVALAGLRAKASDFSQEDLRGFDLAGKVMGVLGVGKIGQRVIQIAKGFGMTVLGCDPGAPAGLEAKLGFRLVDLPSLLSACDVLSLNVPGGEQNVGLISAPQLALMKPTAILINTSRGEVVDAEALVMALSEGRLAGAGLDVFAQEGLLRDEVGMFRPGQTASLKSLRSLAATHALLASPNVIATAHIAYDTQEALGRIISTTRSNILGFVAGKPKNLIAPTLPKSAARPKAPANMASGYEQVMSPLSQDVIRRRETFLADPGPEQVHALRGALRRARAGLLIFKDISTTGECAWIRHELERMIKHLGSLRDLDVLRVQFDMDLAKPSGGFPEGFDALLTSARRAAADQAVLRFRAPRASFLLDGFQDWLQSQGASLPGEDLQAHMVQWLAEADAEVRRRGAEDLGRGDTARHRLREQIKVLKYDFEIYQRIFNPPGAEPYLAALENLHTLLGDMNDDAVGAKLRHSLINPDRRPKNVGRPTKARREALARGWSQFETLPRSWAPSPSKPTDR